MILFLSVTGTKLRSLFQMPVICYNEKMFFLFDLFNKRACFQQKRLSLHTKRTFL